MFPSYIYPNAHDIVALLPNIIWVAHFPILKVPINELQCLPVLKVWHTLRTDQITDHVDSQLDTVYGVQLDSTLN